MIKKIKNILECKKWNLYLYYNGVKIKKIKVYKDKLEDLKNQKYMIKVYFKKQLFNSNIVEIIVSPVVVLHTDDKKRIVCVGVVIEPGTRL